MEDINERKWCVYIHTNKHNNKAYIGITSKTPEDRWGKNGSGYLNKEGNGAYTQPVFARALKKYKDWDNDWEHIIFMNDLSEIEAKHIEVLMIALFKTNCNRYKNPSYGYNMTDGGEGTLGWCPSEETRRKISEKAKERLMDPTNHPWFGKTHSDESKQKMSQIRKGRPAHNKGTSMSEDARKRMSKAHKGINVGKNNPNYGHGNTVIQLDKNGHIIAEYPTVTEASRITNINSSDIYSCCNGKTKTVFGYQWVYKKDYNPNKKYIFVNNHIRPIVQLDKYDNLINEYQSIAEAEKITHIDNRAISAVCKKKRKTTSGFRWMYKEDYDQLTQQNDLNEIEPIENLTTEETNDDCI